MQWKTNKLLDLKNQYVNDLLCCYEKNEAKSLLSLVIHHYFKLSTAGLLSNPDYRLSESEILKLHFAVKELKSNRPVQYILGETDFLDLKLKVNDSVLIPRPETEELVQLILNREKKPKTKVLDIGTGSACIAIALKQSLPEATVTAIDISAGALKLAAENCVINNTSIALLKIDILDKSQWEFPEKFDLIVSNPPYVTPSEMKLMQENVLQYEPHNALFVPDDNALVFYEAIFDFSELYLRHHGRLYFEINEARGDEVMELAKTKNFDKVTVHKDFHGKNRFLSARKI